ncbi:hypothetical protein PkoCFBP13504_30340 [Pseudomonas koreensis]|nr:hypothetical protein PkoCFBP13504_30340 [Pseudomonas koreensis]
MVQPTITVVKIDITNTRNSLARLGSETFNVLEFQREELSDLQNGCDTSDGQYCFSVFGNSSGTDGAHGTSTGFRFGAPIGDYVSYGASISYTNSQISKAFNDSSSKYGFGAYVDFHQPKDSRQWFVRPSISYSKYDTKIDRGYESNTEITNGKAEIKGVSETIEIGERFSYDDKQLSVSSGIQHSKISRSAYSETNATLPVSYNEVDFDDTAAFVRGSITSAITTSVKLVINAELDRKIGGSKPVFQAEGNYIGSVENKAPINKTRESLSAGFIYSPTKQISLSLIPTLGQSALGEKHWSTNLNINYNF